MHLTCHKVGFILSISSSEYIRKKCDRIFPQYILFIPKRKIGKSNSSELKSKRLGIRAKKYFFRAHATYRIFDNIIERACTT